MDVPYSPQLLLSADELSAVIEAKPRGDYEFVDFRFWSQQELADILRNPAGWQLHPTTEYRMFFTLAHQLDPIRVAQMLTSKSVRGASLQ